MTDAQPVHFPMDVSTTWSDGDGGEVAMVIEEITLVRGAEGLDALAVRARFHGGTTTMALHDTLLGEAPTNAVPLRRVLSRPGPLTTLSNWTVLDPS